MEKSSWRAKLEEAQLADLLGGDAGGREVGDAAGFELQADVGDIDVRREHGEADGAEFADGRLCECEHDVEVVNHEVEHDIDVERARREDGEPVDFEEEWTAEQLLRGGHGGVEAFEVADLHDALMLGSEREDVVGFGEGGGEGLFDQAVDAGGEELGGDGGVVNGWNTEAGSVYPNLSSEVWGIPFCRHRGCG
jgi:hypothetical protein